MDSIITVALTAVRVPDYYTEGDSSLLITSNSVSCGEKERESLSWRREGVKRFPGICYRQKARQNGFKQTLHSKILEKLQAFQWGSNLATSESCRYSYKGSEFCGRNTGAVGNKPWRKGFGRQEIPRNMTSRDGSHVSVGFPLTSAEN